MIKYNEALKFLSKWPVWISLILVIVPGVMYNLDWKDIIVSDYSGSLLIVFLISSVYYSIPFFIVGFLLALVVGGHRIEWENLLFEASILSIGVYATTEIFVKSINQVINSLPFWIGFVVVSFIWILSFYIIRSSLDNKPKKRSL